MIEAGRVSRSSRTGNWALLLIGIVLLLAFAGVGWLQAQSISLLNATVRYKGDNAVWSVFQLETEHLRLRQLVQPMALHPEAGRLDAIQQRYEIFVSRVNLAEPERTRDVTPLLPVQHTVRAALNEFVAFADPLLSLGATPPLDTRTWAEIDTRLARLEGLIHDLSLQMLHTVADQTSQRNQAVRDQNRMAIGLTVFQCLLTLLFAVFVVRQLRMLQNRRQRLEELAVNLQEARNDAEQASRAKSAFLANMSHELRTPFNGLLGMLSLLQSSRLDFEQIEHLRTARESGEHLLTILNDVLDISKLESGRIEIEPRVTDLHRLLADIDALMAPQARARHLQWAVEGADLLPRWVLLDDIRFKQVLYNLIGNALKFTAQGGVTLRLERVTAVAATAPDTAELAADQSPPAPDRFRLSICDTGIGMDALTLQRLFRRFAQGDETINRRYGGTGLGLEISRTLARMMGGDISVRSAPGQGSVFTVELPLQALPAPVDAAVLPAAASPAPADDAQARSTEPLDVLVVDDHPVNRKLMQALLRRLGHRVGLCENGAQAVAEVQRMRYDIVLMDVHMPVMDGLAATLAIRQLGGAASRQRIVALTADAFSDSRERVLAAGMDDFLAKPVQLHDIEALLRRHFGARAEVPAAAETAPAPLVAESPDAAAPAAEAAAVPALPKPPKPPRVRFRRGDAARLLDLESIAEVCVGVSLAGYQSLLGGFLADESGSIAELLAVLREHDAAQVRAAAHKFKGAAASLGLRQLADTARELESQGEALTAEQASASAVQLDAELTQARALCMRMGLLAQPVSG